MWKGWRLTQELGEAVFDDHNVFRARFDEAMKQHNKKLSAADKKAIYKAVSWRDEAAPPVIAKRNKLKSASFPRRRESSSSVADSENLDTGIRGYDDALYGRYIVDGELFEYESDTDLRDTEQVPLKEEGGIESFFRREVLPHAPDAWIAMDATKIGYEISFARYFYRPTPLRTLDQIRADILALEQQTEGLLHKIVGAN